MRRVREGSEPLRARRRQLRRQRVGPAPASRPGRGRRRPVVRENDFFDVHGGHPAGADRQAVRVVSVIVASAADRASSARRLGRGCRDSSRVYSCRRRVVDLRQSGQLDDLAAAHHGDPVADVPDHRQVVRDEDQRQRELLHQVGEQVEDLAAHRDVESADRLVGDEDSRVRAPGRGRSRSVAAGRRRTGAGSARPRPAGARPAPSSSSTALSDAGWPVHRSGSAMMSRDAHPRVERTHRVLEDDLQAPAQEAELRSRQAGRCRRAVERDRAGGRLVERRRAAGSAWTCRSRTRRRCRTAAARNRSSTSTARPPSPARCDVPAGRTGRSRSADFDDRSELAAASRPPTAGPIGSSCRVCGVLRAASSTSTASPASTISAVEHHQHALAHRGDHGEVVRDEQQRACIGGHASVISARIWACTVTSSAVVGSSQISSAGSLARAMASTTRCRCPPDSWCG